MEPYCLSHFLFCTKHVKKHPNTLSSNNGHATLLNTIVLKKLILIAIHGMFLKFESQAHTHVSHLETLLGDGKEISRTLNTVIYIMHVLLFPL